MQVAARRASSRWTFSAMAMLFLMSRSAWGGPPFATDDPEPVDYGHWEVNYAITKTWRHAGEASSGFPSIDINYGATPDVQLHAQPRYSVERTAEGSRSGIDDTEIGVKYRVLNLGRGDSKLMLGVYPIFLLPTGDTRLGPDRGKKQIFLPVWAQWDSGDWSVYGGSGYRINPGAGNRNFIFTGATALYRTTDRLRLGAEAFHKTPDTTDGGSVIGFNLGGIYGLAERYNLLFSAGRGFTHDSAGNEVSAYLALQVLY
jgi:hypothetical protein